MRRGAAAAVLTVLLGAGSAAAWQATTDELVPGLVVEFFKLGDAMVEDFPKIEADRKPDVRRVDKQVNYESTEKPFTGVDIADHFYARWSGVIRIPKEGTWTFYTESDDGSRLWIDEKQVVDNGGLHPMEEKSGEVQLKAGDYPIKMDIFENEGQAGVRLSWEADGITKELIPEKALFHKKDKDLDK